MMKKKVLTYLITIAMIFSATQFSAFAAIPEGVPSTIDKVTLLGVKVQENEEGIPYFELEIEIPQSVLDLDADRPTDGATFIEYFRSVDGGEWEPFNNGYLDILAQDNYKVAGKINTYVTSGDFIDEGGLDSIDIKAHKYAFKIKLNYQYYYGEGPGEWDYIYSDFSNVQSIGSGSFYSKSSSWATGELQKAVDAGIIPDILKDADLTKAITREEFCEIAILLYEKMMEVEAEPISPNPFTDTTNVQILKAFKIGITNGTSETSFSPNKLIKREECAAMLFRAIEKIRPDGDYNVANVPDFPDQKYIASWAVNGAKYMAKMEIIKGNTAGEFMPKATTTAQQAAGYGMATREAAVIMAVRILENID